MTELWRPVVGRGDFAWVSDHARVWTRARTVIRSNGAPLRVPSRFRTVFLSEGYRFVTLQRGQWPVKVSVLILESFVGPQPFPGAAARHLNDIHDDDRLDNLAWGTHAENMADKDRNGTGRWLCGDEHPEAKLTEVQVVEIRQRYTGRRGEQKAIAAEFGVSKQLISAIITRAAWRHLP